MVDVTICKIYKTTKNQREYVTVRTIGAEQCENAQPLGFLPSFLASITSMDSYIACRCVAAFAEE